MSPNILADSAYTYEYFRNENVCSLCWKKEIGIIPHTQTKSRQEEVIYKIKDCLGIEFTNSCLQRRTCEECCDKLDEFYEFKQFCRESDRRLREIINNDHNCNGIVQCINIQNSLTHVKFEKADQICDNSTKIHISTSYEEKDEIEFLHGEDYTDEYKQGICDNDPLTKEVSFEDKALSETVTANISDSEQSIKKEPIKNKSKKVLSPVVKKKYKQKRSPTYCNICRLELESIEELATHNASNHGIEGDHKFKCFGCEKRFRSRKARLSHELAFCKGLKEGYKCVKCDRFLPKRSMYETHMRNHREGTKVELPGNIFQCTSCSKLFKTKLSLTEHLVEHNWLKRHFVCETCGRVFTRQDYLHKHMTIHSGIKQYACPHCAFRTAQKSSLTVHIRRHTGERPYKCDLCPQQCISSSNLKAHRRRHLGDKSFECTICNKRFGYKISLEEHIATIHERSQTFPCDICGAIYTRPRGLRRHRLAKHSKEKVDKHLPKDGSASCEQSCTDPMGDGVSDKDDVYLKIVDNIVDKKGTTSEAEIYEIRGDTQFILLNSQGGAELLRKMY